MKVDKCIKNKIKHFASDLNHFTSVLIYIIYIYIYFKTCLKTEHVFYLVGITKTINNN